MAKSALSCLLLVLAALLVNGTYAAELDSTRLCTDPAKSEDKLAALKLLPRDNSISLPTAVQEKIAEFLSTGGHEGWCHDKYPRAKNIRLTGPLIGQDAYTTHARVRVYYSQEVVRWLDDGRRGVIKDGAMIVKAMYSVPAHYEGDLYEPSGWALMFRDSSASHDGWLWFLYYLPGNEATGGVGFEYGQYGNSYCLSCHASTDTDQSTFAFVGNLDDRDVATYLATGALLQPPASNTPVPLRRKLSPHDSFARAMFTMNELLYRPVVQPRSAPNDVLLALVQDRLGRPDIRPRAAQLRPMPPNFASDHIVAGPVPQKKLFLTSDECSGCHDASYLINQRNPHMSRQLAAPLRLPAFQETPMDSVDLSPYGEWTGSMMAMAGRDPIFRAQLEYELSTLDSSQDKHKVSSLCLSCHSVMGQRTHPELTVDPMNVYAALDPNEEHHSADEIRLATYAGLARDGVSCTVCHHIAAEGLGGRGSFTAKFKTGPANEVYGPYSEVTPFPMQRALGLEPIKGKQISDPALCGSCHTIEVPVYEGQQLRGHTFEQTTYMEWANSRYAGTDKYAQQSCQDCHMPAEDPTTGRPMETLIANIEDASFPYVPNRASSVQLGLTERSSYRRHTLVGMNVFGMSMFQQFPWLLGMSTFAPGRQLTVVPPMLFAVEEVLKQARQRTARVAVTKLGERGKNLQVEVKVENLAGHKLPSGVGFRRVFIELAVLDSVGDIIWCSGCTDSIGVIIDTEGHRLATEFARTYAESQPDHANISSDQQVQIYEHRSADAKGELTTSFIHLVDKVKDNRILPLGWRAGGVYAEHTKPVAVEGSVRPGEDRIKYHIPLAQVRGAAAIRVALNYQSIPPYYLLDRFAPLKVAGNSSEFGETLKLLYLVLNLNVDDPRLGMKDWKVALACEHYTLAADGKKIPVAKNCLPAVPMVAPENFLAGGRVP